MPVWMIFRSVPQMPQARTRTRTSSSPGHRHRPLQQLEPVRARRAPSPSSCGESPLRDLLSRRAHCAGVGHDGRRPRTELYTSAAVRRISLVCVIAFRGPEVRGIIPSTTQGGRAMNLLDPQELASAPARRDARLPVADPDPARLQRRVHAVAADARSAAGGGAHQGAGRRAGRRQGMSRRRFLATASGHGGRLPGHERGVWLGLRREPGRGADAGDGQGAGPGALQAVRHGLPHPLPARRHADHGVRAPAGSRRQGGLEPGAGRQAADHRGAQVRELLQRGLPRQRHQGGA